MGIIILNKPDTPNLKKGVRGIVDLESNLAISPEASCHRTIMLRSEIRYPFYLKPQ